MKIVYKEDPLSSIIELTEQEKTDLKFSLYHDMIQLGYSEQEVVDWTDHMYPYLLESLNEIHCGDCTKVPSSCTKCYAEDLLGLSTISMITHPYYVQKAFMVDNVNSLDDAINYLTNNPPVANWNGAEKHVEVWTRQQNKTVQDLIKYKIMLGEEERCD